MNELDRLDYENEQLRNKNIRLIDNMNRKEHENALLKIENRELITSVNQLSNQLEPLKKSINALSAENGRLLRKFKRIINSR